MDIRYAVVALALAACSESAAPAPSPSPSPSASEWRSVVGLELRPVVEGPMDAAACAKRSGILWNRAGDVCYLPGPTALRLDRFVRAAAVQQEDGTGAWVIDLVLPGDLGEQLGEVTETHLDQPLLLVLDGKVLSAPTLQARLSTDVRITGDFTQVDVERIVARLRERR